MFEVGTRFVTTKPGNKFVMEIIYAAEGQYVLRHVAEALSLAALIVKDEWLLQHTVDCGGYLLLGT